MHRENQLNGQSHACCNGDTFMKVTATCLTDSIQTKILVRQTMHGARTPKQYIIWIALVPF